MSLIQAVLIEHEYSGDAIPEDDKWVSILCPYHDESNPSARVNPVAGGFLCHGCGRSGDALKLVRDEGGLDIASARQELARIADEYGEEIPRPRKRRSVRPRVLGESRTDQGDGKSIRPRFGS